MSETILLIDDDVNLLSSMKRQFRGKFDVETATSGEDAITQIEGGKVPSVVVCDMRMGGMNGVSTLAKIKEALPDTVRLMLTGNADMQTAIDAINNGSIFRFLTKPCPPETMEAGLNAALEQYRLVMAERELLEKTLAGSVKVLIDMLALASPLAFGRATRIRTWARKVAVALKLPQRWQIEIAAMLGPIGLLSVPPEVIAKLHAKTPLSEVERRMIDHSPEAARNIIANIPRLAGVSKIVALQNRGFDGSGFPADGPKGTDIPLDARILKILSELSNIATGVSPTRTDFETLSLRAQQFDPGLLGRVRDVLEVMTDLGNGRRPVKKLATGVLLPDMVLAADVMTLDGRLVLSALVQISEAHVESLRNLARVKRISDEIVVFADNDA
ncbi:MAG: response regulator [Rhodospirillaceae bacterium]|nr:response regulator [Rhodospirillaceae bacterium]